MQHDNDSHSSSSIPIHMAPSIRYLCESVALEELRVCILWLTDRIGMCVSKGMLSSNAESNLNSLRHQQHNKCSCAAHFGEAVVVLRRRHWRNHSQLHLVPLSVCPSVRPPVYPCWRAAESSGMPAMLTGYIIRAFSHWQIWVAFELISLDNGLTWEEEEDEATQSEWIVANYFLNLLRQSLMPLLVGGRSDPAWDNGRAGERVCCSRPQFVYLHAKHGFQQRTRRQRQATSSSSSIRPSVPRFHWTCQSAAFVVATTRQAGKILFWWANYSSECRDGSLIEFYMRRYQNATYICETLKFMLN